MIDVKNLHPNWRALRLAHIRQVRMMVRERRYVMDGQRIIKEHQRELADIRAAVKAARAEEDARWRAQWQAEFNRTTHCGGDV